MTSMYAVCTCMKTKRRKTDFSGTFSATFSGTLLNLTWLCTKPSQTFSGNFSGTLLNLTRLCTKASQTFTRIFCWTWPGSAPKPPRPSPESVVGPGLALRQNLPDLLRNLLRNLLRRLHQCRSYSGLKTPLAYAIGEKCKIGCYMASEQLVRVACGTTRTAIPPTVPLTVSALLFVLPFDLIWIPRTASFAWCSTGGIWLILMGKHGNMADKMPKQIQELTSLWEILRLEGCLTLGIFVESFPASATAAAACSGDSSGTALQVEGRLGTLGEFVVWIIPNVNQICTTFNQSLSCWCSHQRWVWQTWTCVYNHLDIPVTCSPTIWKYESPWITRHESTIQLYNTQLGG